MNCGDEMTTFDFIKTEPIEKGWSGDKKYCVTKEDGTKLLLRISPIEQLETKKAEFEMMKRVEALGVPMCLPVEFGTCEDSGKAAVYSLQSWIDGEEADEKIPFLPDTEQYLYGIKAGEILRKIHSIPVPDSQEDWESRFNRKIDRNIKGYTDCPIKYNGGEAFIEYINENRHLLHGRPQCYQHGDYHISNMMIENGELKIIDFNRNDFGDPWEEFNRIVWCAKKSPLFASGMVNGYFGGKPTMDFWRLLALYIASNTLSSIYWAIQFGQGQINTMLSLAQDVLNWYDGMKNPVPKWYFEGYYIQYINGLPYKLKSPFDFSFISKYGTVFKVFDNQDSGNICFGVQNGEDRYFIKFAGALTEQYGGTPQDAVDRLKAAVPIYTDLSHPNLIKFVKAEETGGGFALIFEWTDGECMGRMYPESRRKFMQMPIETRLKVFNDILSFHTYIAKQGHVAVDFYDGCILYDFKQNKTMICDIDFYIKLPYTNIMGRMWGSTRFMSPEEFTLGADINEITNVYTMGATAFALFANSDRSLEKWPLNEKLYAVVNRAVNDDRNERQQSIRQFIDEWKSKEKSCGDETVLKC